MKPLLTQPRGWWISSRRWRKELIPVPNLIAYRCIATMPDGPETNDIILPDEVAWEDVLIDLGVMPARDTLTAGFAKLWRAARVDDLLPRVRRTEPAETLLYRLDSPHRPKN